MADHTVTSEEQIAQLKAAGWIHVRGNIWRAPVDGYFLGPNQAWEAMICRAKKYEHLWTGKPYGARSIE